MTQYERIILAKSGDQESIDILVSEHEKYIRFLSRCYQFSDREDAFQSGVSGFIEAINDFDLSRGLKLITFAAWRIRRSMQNIHRQAARELLYDDVGKIDPDDKTISIENHPQPEQPKIEKKLMDAIAQLSDIEREILKLHFFDGLTMRQIGEIIQLSHQRVYQLESRAIKTLKGLMNER